MSLLFLVVFFVLALAPPAWAVNRYASPGGSGSACTQGSPCSLRTCIEATTAGNACLLRSGTYVQEIRTSQMTIHSGTSDSNVVWIGADTGQTATIAPNSGAIVAFEYGQPTQYVVIDGLVLDGSNANVVGCFGVQGDTHHITLQNSECRNIHSLGPSCSLGPPEVCPGGQGITAGFGAHHITFRNIHAHHNGFNRLDHNFYLACPDCIIEDSDIHDSTGYGIQIYESGCSGCADRMIVRNNRIYNNQGDGGVTLNHGNNIKFYNNLVYNNNSGGIRGACHRINNTQIYNNTFYGNNGPSVDICDDNVTNTQVKNNIMFSSSGPQNVNAGSGTAYSNNLCSGSSGLGCDHFGDPRFVSAGLANFAIQSDSAAKNQGINLSSAGVTDDFVHFARPSPAGGAYDIGSYEFNEGGGPPPPTGPTVRYMGPSGGSGVSDGNTCDQSKTRTTAKATFASALACMNPGDTLYLLAGTYNQAIRTGSMTVPNGTSPTEAITIASAPGEIATLSVSGPIVIDFSTFAGRHYIVFDRLVFDCTPGGDQCGGVYIGAGNDHITFTNVEMKSNYNTVVRPEQSAGMAISGEGDSIKFQNCHLHGWQRYGAYVRGANWLFEGCDIHHNGAFGIHIFNVGDTTISNNIVRRSFVHHNSMIPDVANGGSSGILLSSGTNNQAYNNVVYSNGEGNSYNTAGIQVGNSVDALVYNNTIWGNSGMCMSIDSGSTNTQVKNNLCFHNTHATEIWNDTGSTVFLKNMCESPGGTGCDVLTTDPLFANLAATPPNFQLQPDSQAKDAGTPLALVNTDFAGVSRPQPPDGNYDIGAYEAPAGAGRVSPATFWIAPGGVDPPSRTCTTALNNIDMPLQTFNAGRACLTVAGDKLFLRAGSYEASMATATQPITNGTDWGNATTIAAHATEVATLSLPPTSDVVVYFNTTNQFIVLDRLILDCHNQAGSNGLAITAPAHHIRFQKGEIRNCHYEPVYIESSDNNEILTSLIHGSAITSCIGLTANSDTTILRGNTIHTCAGAGIIAGDPNSGTIIRDNQIHGAGTTGIALFALTSPEIINNIVYSNNLGIQLFTGTSNAKVYNNTVHGNTTQGILVDSGVTGTAITNNIVAANTTAQILNNGTGPPPLTNLLTAPPFDPAFPDKFHLTSASVTAIDTGTTLTADVPTDYEGIARPQPLGGLYDIGASEFQSTGGPTEPPPPGVAIRAPYWRSQGFFWR